MILLKINNKKTKVPQVHELSAEKYIKLLQKGDFSIIDYLSIALDMSVDKASNIRIKNPSFLAMQLYGVFPDYSKRKPKKHIVLGEKRYKLDPDCTLGQRFIIEENGKNLKDFELMIFILAVFADQENYSELIEKIKKSPASEIMPEAFFLFKSLQIGSKLGRKLLRALIYLTPTRT